MNHLMIKAAHQFFSDCEQKNIIPAGPALMKPLIRSDMAINILT